jgi:hypothetical protein
MRIFPRVTPLRRFHLAALSVSSLFLMSSAASAVDVNSECAALYGTSFVASTGQVAASVPSVARPLKGVRQRDPNFGTCMYRATDHAVEPPTSYARNDYARRQAFNADNSMFIVYASGGGWHLYNANTLAYIKQLSFTGINEPQWDAKDPKSLYFLPNKGGMTMSKLNVDTNTSTVVANFTGRLPWSGMARAYTAGEGSPSADSRYWCFMAENSSGGILGVFTYDLHTNTILGSKTLTSKPNHVSMSPTGRWCVVAGTTAYSRDFKSSKTLLSGSQHNDLALGADGQDYYVFVNQAVDGYVTMKSIDTGISTKLIPTWIDGSTTSGHLSGKAFSRPGWILYSSFNHSGTSEKWLHERVVAVEMKSNPKIINVAHHHEYYNGYWTQPHATVSRDFSRVVFNSNWGSTSDLDVDTYLARLPDNLFGGTVTPPPPAADTVAPTVTASTSVTSTTVGLGASASDNVGVSSVDFMVDGVLQGNDTSSPYSLAIASSKLANGNHSLVAVAYDQAGNAGQSAPVPFSVSTTVTASDTVAPTVSASVSVRKGGIMMKAAASDNVGVTKVEFWVDGVIKATDTSAAYSADWNTSSWAPKSKHSLVAKAYDAAGNVRSSSAVSFTVR